MRAWHNSRATCTPWNGLNLVIGHAVEAQTLIRDRNQSPFNVGVRLTLDDFTSEQVAILNERHHHPLKNEHDLQSLMELIGGHPYLVRQALYSLVINGWSVAQLRTVAITAKQWPKIDVGNTNHLGAPMSGSIVTVAVKVGQLIKKGDPLVSIEAMKMESMLRAERDGSIKAIHVKLGDAVAAKDLLLEFL